MRSPDYARWFDDYARLLTRSIGGPAEVRAFRDRYDRAFIASGPRGPAVARNSWLLNFVVRAAARFHRRVGTVETRVASLETTPLFEDHDAVRVVFESDHHTADGLRTLPFEITYLMRRVGEGEARIFGFIGEDETAVYQRYGLVDGKGRPRRRA